MSSQRRSLRPTLDQLRADDAEERNVRALRRRRPRRVSVLERDLKMIADLDLFEASTNRTTHNRIVQVFRQLGLDYWQAWGGLHMILDHPWVFSDQELTALVWLGKHALAMKAATRYPADERVT
ncbi:MAG: hypothetical protein ACHQ0J_10465 [Candidatus Dormibacterales bacterium]